MKFRFLYLLASLTFAYNIQADEIPEGWHLTGSIEQNYTFKLDKGQGKPAPSGHLSSSKKIKKDEFGTLMQSFIPKDYLGKRVKLTAWVKVKDVENWSGLWMRVDTPNKNDKAFDDMKNRPIKGQTDWKQYSIVLDVAADATNLSYGFLLAGSGEAWFDNFEFTTVSNLVPTTGSTTRDKPINNDF